MAEFTDNRVSDPVVLTVDDLETWMRKSLMVDRECATVQVRIGEHITEEVTAVFIDSEGDLIFQIGMPSEWENRE